MAKEETTETPKTRTPSSYRVTPEMEGKGKEATMVRDAGGYVHCRVRVDISADQATKLLEAGFNSGKAVAELIAESANATTMLAKAMGSIKGKAAEFQEKRKREHLARQIANAQKELAALDAAAEAKAEEE